MTLCPLCDCENTPFFHRDATREYRRCRECQLIFVPEQFWLGHTEEKAVYDLHENHINDAGYRHFLSRLCTPLLSRLGAAPRYGLDFGCGPGPALAAMLEEHGHSVDLYDPIYFNRPALLSNQYDFICTTEVVEHFRNPKSSFSLVFNMLKPSGWFAVMTKRVRDEAAFKNWHYIRDPTHILFYNEKTFAYLAEQHHAELEPVGTDVVLFRKESTSPAGMVTI